MLCCVHSDWMEETVFQRLRHRMGMNDSKVEALDFLIVADPAFVEHTLVLKHISLTSLALAKAVKDWFRDRVQTVSDCVHAAVSFSKNLVVIGTVAKVQSRMSFQNLTALDRFQRPAHRIGQTLCREGSMALNTGITSHITHTDKLMSRPPS